MAKIKKSPMKQISLKLSTRQLEELRNYANSTGENPVSFHIRQAIAEYLQKRNKEVN